MRGTVARPAMTRDATPLSDVYCARRPSDQRAEGAERASLEQQLATLWQRAQDTWADVSIPVGLFLEQLAESGVDLAADIAPRAAEDIFLASACGLGDDTALRHLERHYLSVVPAALAHMKLPAAMVEEVAQLVRSKLLVAAPGERPKIAEYASRGKLRGLIQLVSVRTAISLLRKQKRESPASEDRLLQLPTPGDDPELGYLKARYRRDFREAFADSVQDLTPRERNLLRLHLLRGVTLHALASMYSVHRATVVRWLAKAREKLFSGTRKRMRKRLDVDADEFDSVMRLIQSRLDVSVQRLFATDADADEPHS